MVRAVAPTRHDPGPLTPFVCSRGFVDLEACDPCQAQKTPWNACAVCRHKRARPRSQQALSCPGALHTDCRRSCGRRSFALVHCIHSAWVSGCILRLLLRACVCTSSAVYMCVLTWEGQPGDAKGSAASSGRWVVRTVFGVCVCGSEHPAMQCMTYQSCLSSPAGESRGAVLPCCCSRGPGAAAQGAHLRGEDPPTPTTQ
jgi:hypothetical protein